MRQGLCVTALAILELNFVDYAGRLKLRPPKFGKIKEGWGPSLKEIYCLMAWRKAREGNSNDNERKHPLSEANKGIFSEVEGTNNVRMSPKVHMLTR